MPFPESTRMRRIESRSAGVFCVAKVRAVPWVVIVPMGWLKASPTIALTTWVGVSE
jgi:hypothetical protein